MTEEKLEFKIFAWFGITLNIQLFEKFKLIKINKFNYLINTLILYEDRAIYHAISMI
jgi:hypothetical protein